MKIALVAPNNLWVSPYVNIYTRLLDSQGADYDVISWNREGRKENCIQYDYQPKGRNPFALLWSYKKYAAFVKKTIKQNNYDRLIVFTPQTAIFLKSFLAKYYKGRYIFDYRDLSLEQKFYFKSPFLKVLQNSYANVISSPGFKKYLPNRFDYVLSHNFNIDIVKQAIGNDSQPSEKGKMKVLTIGAIRTDMNPEVINALGDVEGVQLSFVGKGPASQSLEDYVRSKGYKNITFRGFYNKEEESEIIKDCSFINIFYPQIPSHITAVSNRFYNSLIYKRPMLVTKNSTQGDYAEKYNVGLAIENCNNLASKLNDFISHLDFKTYCCNCNKLLEELLKDYENWKKVVLSFANDKCQ